MKEPSHDPDIEDCDLQDLSDVDFRPLDTDSFNDITYQKEIASSSLKNVDISRKNSPQKFTVQSKERQILKRNVRKNKYSFVDDSDDDISGMKSVMAL